MNGGYQFNGEEITPLDEDELIGCIQTLRANGINNVVVSGIFSSVNPAQEIRVGFFLLTPYSFNTQASFFHSDWSRGDHVAMF